MTPEEIAAQKKLDDEKAAADKAAADKAAADKAAEETAPAGPTQAELDEARRELKELKDAEDARKTAELSEIDREKKRAEDAITNSNAKDATIRRLAILQGVRDVQGDLKLDLDMSAVRDLYEAKGFDAVKVDENGEPVGLAEHIKALVKTKPYVVKTAALAPDINASKRGKDETTEKDSESRKADLARRFRIKK